MNIINNNKGFNVIEVLIVASVMGLIVIMSGVVSHKYAERRSVDSVAHKITSYLNLTKLQSSRNGVEYQSTLEYDGSDNELDLITKVGDSNRNSDFDNITPEVTEVVKMFADYEIIPSGQVTFTFSPSSAMADDTTQTVTIKPSVTEIEADIRKCAVITVTRFGRIQTLIGNWDFTGDVCVHIVDTQESP